MDQVTKVWGMPGCLKRLFELLELEVRKSAQKDPIRIAGLADALEDAAKGRPTGEYRLIATAILGGAAGNVTGGASEFARVSAVNYLQGLTTQQVKLYADMLGDGAEAQTVRAALHQIINGMWLTLKGYPVRARTILFSRENLYVVSEVWAGRCCQG